MEKEYIVTLKKNIDPVDIHEKIVSEYTDRFFPDRKVVVANARPKSIRNTHYYLTDQEAENLRQDPRVLAVELPPENRNDIEIVADAVQQGDFSKTTFDSGNFVNWGLVRINFPNNIFGADSETSENFNFTLDGSGVDIVIQDSGLQADHPEFEDENGNSRVKTIDWYQESGIPGTMPPGFETDYDGHGTHCGGIAAGKTYGWAKNANIYVMKLAGLEGTSDPNTGIPISDTFDVIKEWHNNKPIDAKTGFKRPTIVNMSWGYRTFYNDVGAITYRGVEYTGTDIDSESKRFNFGLVPLGFFNSYTNVRIPSVDADVEELIDAGVHVVIAAGNNSHKIDIPGGLDYNNSMTKLSNSEIVFYHRGSSPSGDGSIIVGNIDSSVFDQETDQKATTSETGPGVDVYAPGTNIMSCTSNVNKFSDGVYPLDSNFRICNISGTSMAAPQVVGLLSLFLQLNPHATTIESKKWLLDTSISDIIYSTNLDNDYTNLRSLLGINNRFVFNPFNTQYSLRIQSL